MNYNSLIKQNTIEINRLTNRVNETFGVKKKKDEWSSACDEFHEKYTNLCFWNGIWDYKNEIRSNNIEAIEYYITFIEIRPFFFRSGYMFNDLMRVFKNIPLNTNHKKRFDSVNAKYLLYRKNRKSNKS